jgi:lysozyme family protein
MTPVPGFEFAFWMVIGHEGKLSLNPRDDGNWTGGRQGVGELKGTKFGISAASYPHLDIRNLTLEEAKAIYLRDYWGKGKCEQLPPPLALLYFDACVNAGFGSIDNPRATIWLQRSLGVAQDSIIGPITLAAARRAVENESRITSTVARYQKERTFHNMTARRWVEFGEGWTIRTYAVVMMVGRLFQQMQGSR